MPTTLPVSPVSPGIETNLDTSAYQSNPVEGDPAVSTAEVSESTVATLDPPTDIDAATIGDYTPYTDVQGSVDKQSTVSGQLEGLLSQAHPYIGRARTEAAQYSNRRGMLNSSMAAGAAEGAAIDRALPIAQADALANLEQQFVNQGYSNDAAKALADQSMNREDLAAGFEQDTNVFNAANTIDNDRLDTDATNASNTAATLAENNAATAAALAENNKNFEILQGDILAQLKGIDSDAATRLETLKGQFGLLENQQTIDGNLYKEAMAQIGAIVLNSETTEESQGKINQLLNNLETELGFTTGGMGDASIGGDGTGGTRPPDVTPPAPAPAPAPAPFEPGGDGPGD